MAAKTTSGSGFDRIFRLFGPGFLLESEFIHACIEAVPSGADKCAFCDFVKSDIFVSGDFGASISQQRNKIERPLSTVGVY